MWKTEMMNTVINKVHSQNVEKRRLAIEHNRSWRPK